MMASYTYYTVGGRVVWCDGRGRVWHATERAERVADLVAKGYVRIRMPM
jgi:hypothetical protein